MYRAGVTDNPTYVLSIVIDGQAKKVVDYVGSWEGIPAVITELEDEVDALAQTQRWIDGSDGLVQTLQAEKFSFQTFDAQLMLKEAASRGGAETVRNFLKLAFPWSPCPLRSRKNDTWPFPLRPWDGSTRPAVIPKSYGSSSKQGRARTIRAIRTWLWSVPLVQEV
jgi:hypothetical protein